MTRNCEGLAIAKEFCGGTLNPVDCIIQIWWFLLGAVVGSFLNVVIYRLPRGESLVWPPSHCPMCRHPIRWFDNLPVLSWFLLRGRCRDCGAPIALRYPLVELLAALLTGSVAWKIAGGYWTLAKPGPLPGMSGVILDGLQTVAVASHLLTLVAVVAILWDRKAVPASLWWPAVALVLGATVLSGFSPVPTVFFGHSYISQQTWIAMAGSVLAAGLAELLGEIRLRQYIRCRERDDRAKKRPPLAGRDGSGGDRLEKVTPANFGRLADSPVGMPRHWDWMVAGVLWCVILPGIGGAIPALLALCLELTMWGPMLFRGKRTHGPPCYGAERWLRSRSVLLALWGTVVWGLVLLWG